MIDPPDNIERGERHKEYEFQKPFAPENIQGDQEKHARGGQQKVIKKVARDFLFQMFDRMVCHVYIIAPRLIMNNPTNMKAMNTKWAIFLPPILMRLNLEAK